MLASLSVQEVPHIKMEQAAIADWQGAREETTFIAKPTPSNRNVLLISFQV
jgi:hypothetical protein